MLKDAPVGWPVDKLPRDEYYHFDYERLNETSNPLYIVYHKKTDSFRLFRSVSYEQNGDGPNRPSEVLRHVSYGYFVFYYGSHKTSEKINQLWYEFEYTSCGNLELYLNYMKENKEKISTLQKLIIILNSLFALAILHNVPNVLLIHRNISPEEIFLSYDNTNYLYIPLISGFDKSRVLPNNYNDILTKQQISKYAAPETLENDQYTSKADIYSLGMVLYELITGNQIFYNIPNLKEKGKENSEILRKAVLIGFSKSDELSRVPSLYSDLLNYMLNIDPNKRLDALQLIYRFRYCVINNYETYDDDDNLTDNIKLVFNKYYQKGELEIENINRITKSPHIPRPLHGKLNEVENILNNGIAPWAYQNKIQSYLNQIRELDQINCE